MKNFIKGILWVVIMLCNLYFGLLFLATVITILTNSGTLGFCICVLIIMAICGWMYNIVDNI